jgi:hypothetical protein
MWIGLIYSRRAWRRKESGSQQEYRLMTGKESDDIVEGCEPENATGPARYPVTRRLRI